MSTTGTSAAHRERGTHHDRVAAEGVDTLEDVVHGVADDRPGGLAVTDLLAHGLDSEPQVRPPGQDADTLLEPMALRRIAEEFQPPHAAGVVVPRKPIVGSFAGCCARAASGHPAAAPLSSVMKSRRLMLNLPLLSRFTALSACHRAAGKSYGRT